MPTETDKSERQVILPTGARLVKVLDGIVNDSGDGIPDATEDELVESILEAFYPNHSKEVDGLIVVTPPKSDKDAVEGLRREVKEWVAARNKG